LEEAGRAKKAKKGFLTPERKKKLRKLLMLKAAEDLKQQQMLKEQERQRILAERIVQLPDLDSMSESGWIILDGGDDLIPFQPSGSELGRTSLIASASWRLSIMICPIRLGRRTSS